MKTKIRQISNKPFIRNVFIVVSGTAAAQLITMAFSPIITRIYGPEAFGLLGVFMALVAILSPIAAGTYPLAIVLPKSEEEAIGIVNVSVYGAIIMSLLSFIVIVIFHQQIVWAFNIETISNFLYLVPLVLLFAATLEIVKQWLLRTKKFRLTAKTTFLNALVINSAKVGIGWFFPVAIVLVVIATITSLCHTILLLIGDKSLKNKVFVYKYRYIDLKRIVKKYKDFPLFRAPQTFLNALSQSLPVLLLSTFFGPASAGFYTLGKTVLGAPTQLIGKSVGDVFYPRIAEAANKGENLLKLIIKATLALAVVGILPFGIVVAFGPLLFGFVFGDEWIVAGEYARWLALWSFFAFINRPSAKAIPVLKLQGYFLIYEIVSTILRAGVLIMGFYLFQSDIIAVILFSISGVVLNIYLVLYTINKAKSIAININYSS